MSKMGRAGPLAAGLGLLGMLLATVFFLRDAERPEGVAPAAKAPAVEPGVPAATTPAAIPRAAARPDPPPQTWVDRVLPEPETGADWIDDEGRPSRELVRTALEVALREHYASHKLSEDDVERLTDAVLRLREARLALAELPEEQDLAPIRRALVEQIEDAGRTFAEVMEMGLDEFTAGAGAGIDTFDPDEPVPEPEFLSEPR